MVGKKSNKKYRRKAGKKAKSFAKNRRIELAKDLSKELLDKYRSWIKAIILHGSVLRNEFKSTSDMDILVLVDDTKKDYTKALKEKITKDLYYLVKKIGKQGGKNKEGEYLLHPQPAWTITGWMKSIKSFHPLTYSILKGGVPIFDTGFFSTNKRLLEMGEIRGTTESADKCMYESRTRLNRAKKAKFMILSEDAYFGCIRAAEAVLIYMGVEVPDPKYAPDKINKHLVEPGLIDKKYVDWLKDIYRLRKTQEHASSDSQATISGKELDEYLDKFEKFMKKMNEVLEKLKSQRKSSSIQNMYDIMVKGSVMALKSIDKLPEDPKELPKAFREELVKTNKLDPVYENVFTKVLGMKKAMNDKNLGKVTERDIYSTNDYVKKFLGEVRRLMKESGKKPEEITKEVSKTAENMKKKGSKKSGGQKKTDSKNKSNDKKSSKQKESTSGKKSTNKKP